MVDKMNNKSNRFFFLPLITNGMLFLLKIILGITFLSLALISDAINNVFDWISSILFAIGSHVSIKKPDENHPLGHGRAEYVTALVLGTIMAMVGFQLFFEAIPLILSPQINRLHWSIPLLVFFSVLMKIGLYVFYQTRFHQTQRLTHKAIALDSLGDVFIGVMMLTGFAIEFYFPTFIVEGYLTFVIAGIIAWNGMRLAIKTSKDMLGRPLSERNRQEIIAMLRKYPIIQGMHSLVYHDYGPYHHHVSFHIELPSRLSLVESHNLIDEIEQKIALELAFECLIHIDPLQEPTPLNMALFEKIKRFLKEKNIDDSTLLIKAVDEVLHPELIVYGLTLDQFKAIRVDLQRTFDQFQFIFGDISFYS